MAHSKRNFRTEKNGVIIWDVVCLCAADVGECLSIVCGVHGSCTNTPVLQGFTNVRMAPCEGVGQCLAIAPATPTSVTLNVQCVAYLLK